MISRNKAVHKLNTILKDIQLDLLAIYLSIIK